ncbi:MAG: calcium-binding EGF-like domain-containing protein [Chitinophagales bacterium]
MKKILPLLVMLLAIAGLNSCNKACNPECYAQGGSCDGKTGKCSCKQQYFGKDCSVHCPYGKEGDSCEILSREKFLGTWSCNTKVGNSSAATVTHLLQISAKPYFTAISIYNVNDEQYYFNADMHGTELFEALPQQALDAVGHQVGQVDASGQLKDGKLKLNVTKDGQNYFCDCSKQ